MAVIDLNSALADQHRSGILVEDLRLFHLCRRCVRMFECESSQILVDGKERET